MVVYPLNQKIEQFAREHRRLSKGALIGMLSLGIIVWIPSFIFGGILVEEMINACTNHTTVLQTLGLHLDGLNKFCSNTDKHTYLTTSLIEIASVFGLGIQSWWLSGFSLKWIRKLSSNKPNDEEVVS